MHWRLEDSLVILHMDESKCLWRLRPSVQKVMEMSRAVILLFLEESVELRSAPKVITCYVYLPFHNDASS